MIYKMEKFYFKISTVIGQQMISQNLLLSTLILNSLKETFMEFVEK